MPHTALPALPPVPESEGFQLVMGAGRKTSLRMMEGPGPPMWTGPEGTPGQLPCSDLAAS